MVEVPRRVVDGCRLLPLRAQRGVPIKLLDDLGVMAMGASSESEHGFSRRAIAAAEAWNAAEADGKVAPEGRRLITRQKIAS